MGIRDGSDIQLLQCATNSMVYANYFNMVPETASR